MAIGLGALLAITGITAGISSLIDWATSDRNRKADQQLNQQNIQAQKEANALNRQQALEDFNRVNAYNDPKQQMQRLKEAGLNPNLVYGSGATTLASSIRGTDNKAPSLTRESPIAIPGNLPDVGNVLMQHNNMQAVDANTRNVELKNEMMDLEGQIKQQELIGKTIGNDASAFDLKVNKELKDTTVLKAQQTTEMQKEDIILKKLQQERIPFEMGLAKEKFALDRAKTRQEMESASWDIVNKRWQAIVTNPAKLRQLQLQFKQMERQGIITDLQTELIRKGVDKSGTFTRILIRMADAMNQEGGTMDNIDKKYNEFLDDYIRK